MVDLIIRKGKPSPIGHKRSEMEENIRKEWGPTVTDVQLDKIKFLEKKIKDAYGKEVTRITPSDADKV